MAEQDPRPGIRSKTHALAAGAAVLTVAAVTTLIIVNSGDTPTPLRRLAEVITEVDWKHASITVPANGDGCPAGTVDLKPVQSEDDLIAEQSWAPGLERQPNLVVRASKVTYGDVTGDGQPEAVLSVRCSDLKPDSSSDEGLNIGGQLLVVAMRPDHSLVGLGYAGPVGALFPSFAVRDQQLVAQVHGGSQGDGHAPGYSINTMTHSRSYRWSGTQFDQTAGRSSALTLTDEKGKIGSPIKLAAIKQNSSTVCPAEMVRFHESEATGGGVSYRLQSKIQPVDFDKDGDEELLAQVECVLPDGRVLGSLYLFGQGKDEVIVRDVPVANAGQYAIQRWTLDNRTLKVTVRLVETNKEQTYTMTWNGTQFSNRLGEFAQATL